MPVANSKGDDQWEKGLMKYTDWSLVIVLTLCENPKRKHETLAAVQQAYCTLLCDHDLGIL